MCCFGFLCRSLLLRYCSSRFPFCCRSILGAIRRYIIHLYHYYYGIQLDYAHTHSVYYMHATIRKKIKCTLLLYRHWYRVFWFRSTPALFELGKSNIEQYIYRYRYGYNNWRSCIGPRTGIGTKLLQKFLLTILCLNILRCVHEFRIQLKYCIERKFFRCNISKYFLVKFYESAQ